ncbi:uncharacterized protein [Aegilops tauschii subsp. strangulata]|uniref:uncharacterized protein n=1 Tax=Aegilops tauschii subsp. strangulata TaxID=200361 RepID=UPI003CC87DFB
MFIDVKIEEANNVVWRLTGMYGEFRWENKHMTWSRMRQLHQNLKLPWILLGDLNEIQYLHEKDGGNPRPIQYMQAFQQVIEDCEMHDLGFIGDKFTWHRGRIKERLDRGLVNDTWSVLFPHAALQNMEYNHSDHRPLVVDTEYYAQTVPVVNDVHARRFEARWLREKSFNDTVLEAWSRVEADPGLTSIYGKLNKMHAEFHDWDQRVMKKPKKRLRKAQRDLENVMAGPMNDEADAKKKELAELIEYLLELEEIEAMQYSRATWLTSGDRNPGFFQAFASAKRKRNFVKKLKDAGDTLNAASLQHVLETYCQSSGQLLNIDTEALSDKYLGLPAMVGADRSDCFRHFCERIKERLRGWMEKQLSTGGKEILIKSVAQAIPVFAMSVFNIPKGICKEITDLIAQFWWGDDEEHKRMHWYTW